MIPSTIDCFSAESSSMPAIFTATITVVTMLAHSFVGCCWHHGHTVHNHEHHGSSSASAIHDADAPDHAQAAEAAAVLQGGIDEPVGQSGCAESSCTYLKPQSLSMDLCAASGIGDWDAPRAHSSLPALSGIRTPEHPREKAGAPPLRARLSVWLL